MPQYRRPARKASSGLGYAAVALVAGLALGLAILANDPTRSALIVTLLIVFLAWGNDRRLGGR